MCMEGYRILKCLTLLLVYRMVQSSVLPLYAHLCHALDQKKNLDTAVPRALVRHLFYWLIEICHAVNCIYFFSTLCMYFFHVNLLVIFLRLHIL